MVRQARHGKVSKGQAGYCAAGLAGRSWAWQGMEGQDWQCEPGFGLIRHGASWQVRRCETGIAEDRTSTEGQGMAGQARRGKARLS